VNMFGRKSGSLINLCSLNFTPTSFILYWILRCINYLVAPMALLISCVFIFHHLVQHRRYFTKESSSLGVSIKIILSNHRDFIIQPLLFTSCIMPNFILGQIMTCSKADTHFFGKMRTISTLLSDSALILTFFIFVAPSKLYMQGFWNTSYAGRFLCCLRDRPYYRILRKQSMSPESVHVSDTVVWDTCSQRHDLVLLR
jgi:hypothetical protein